MRTILVTSTEAYSGKSGLILALIETLASRGKRVGYFKPYGSMPVTVDGVLTDQDAYYINRLIDPPAPVEAVCPVVKTRTFIEEFMAGRGEDVRSRVKWAFDQVADDRDVVIIEGPADVFQGSAVELSACDLADLLDAKALVVTKPSGVEFPDALLGACDCLSHRLAGTVFNWVHPSTEAFIVEHVVPFLQTRDVPVFGILPQDNALSAVTVREIVDALGGQVLSAEDKLDELVESFMIGAMGQEKALNFFRRRARKAVITGGDRADVLLAALETDTRCLILTGNLPPSSIVLSRADDLGVPMVLVDMDTLAAVEKVDDLMGHTRLHDPQKADRIRQSFQTHVDVPSLLEAFGID